MFTKSKNIRIDMSSISFRMNDIRCFYKISLLSFKGFHELVTLYKTIEEKAIKHCQVKQQFNFILNVNMNTASLTQTVSCRKAFISDLERNVQHEFYFNINRGAQVKTIQSMPSVSLAEGLPSTVDRYNGLSFFKNKLQDVLLIFLIF